MSTPVRPAMPAALAARPFDARRNLPIPAVAVFDGAVNFAAINGQVALDLARARRCGLCAEPLAYWVAFLGGPQAATVGTYGDPPMHPDCAEAAIRLCPHIALSQHRRLSDTRQTHLANGETVTVAEGWVEDKPVEWVLYITRNYEIDFAPTQDGGHAAIYRPRPAKSLRRFSYDRDGLIMAGVRRDESD